MKRRQVTAAFATLSLALSAMAVSQWAQLHLARNVNRAVGEVPPTLTAEEFARSASTSDGSDSVQVRFARASALLNAGTLELAEKQWSIVASDDSNPQAALAAQYNLANGYLREALKTDPSSGQYRSLIELAKQRYRDLLTATNDHWASRHNLELALRLSPESEAYEVDDKGKPIKSVSVVFPGFEDRELP